MNSLASFFNKNHSKKVKKKIKMHLFIQNNCTMTFLKKKSNCLILRYYVVSKYVILFSCVFKNRYLILSASFFLML